MKSFTLLPLAATLASAHYGLTYPPWRADTLSDAAEAEGLSQWTYPCAGAPAHSATSPNRTAWPVDGGSLRLDLHHDWTYLFVNLGLGVNATNFNISLTPEFLNVTGAGQFCLPKLELPKGTPVRDGDLATIQVVTVGDSGSALYNCADIRFASNATTLSSDECTTDDGMESYAVKEQTGEDDSNDSNDDNKGDDEGAAAGLAASAAMAAGGALMAAFFAMV